MVERIIEINDPSDARIADYINIRERDLLRKQQTFICEGRTVLQVLVRQTHFKIKSLLILQNRLEGIGSIIQSLADEVPIYVAERSVMDAIAGFPIHRGVLAAAEKPAVTKSELNVGPVVIASALANHDNVGALFRNAAAFDVSAVFLDAQCCDPLYRKAIRVSVGGVLQVPFHHGGPLETTIASLEAQNYTIAALAPNGDLELNHWRPPEKVALLVGSEGEGLPQDVLNKLQTVRISMHGGFDSLNVATTAAIALHHIQAYRQTA